MLRIVMDSAGDCPFEWLEDFDIQVIPISIHFRGRNYLHGVELTDEQFYEMADAGQDYPKTSQPSPQQFIEFYRRIAKVGDTILSLHVTAKLSGTFSSAVMAARELAEEYHVIPFDTETGSLAMGFMCREARLLERAGASLEKILQRLDHMRQANVIALTLDTLEYARRSGRVRSLQAALAAVLQIKPVITRQNGTLEVVERVRTRHRALDRILEIVSDEMGNRLVNVAVMHARAPEVAQVIFENVKRTLNCAELFVSDLSIGIAANLGPGTVGIIAMPVEEG